MNGAQAAFLLYVAEMIICRGIPATIRAIKTIQGTDVSISDIERLRAVGLKDPECYGPGVDPPTMPPVIPME